MTNLLRYRNTLVALLITGSAILLISCSSEAETEEQDLETLMTQQSDSLTIISSENGQKDYRFETPLLERYELAKEPYMEFRKGINIVTYDSLGQVETSLIADYAINFENQKLWEAKGNVVAKNANGQILETQQLFWNQKTKKVYSNVDSKVTQNDDVIVGVGFESDESMEDFTFRKPKGKLLVDVAPTDSTAAVANDSIRHVQTSAAQPVTPSSSVSNKPAKKIFEKREGPKILRANDNNEEQRVKRKKLPVKSK